MRLLPSLRRALWLAALAAISLCATPRAFAENRVALVIGQAGYTAVTPLINTANDAKMMSQLLTDAGFEVMSAADLTQTQMREAIAAFVGKVAAKGPDTVALVFYAGHGLQVDGENFLIPVDLNPQRDADVSIQAVRLNDLLNTLASVPSKMRIVMIDACRNNPFPEIGKTAGRGLALVDAKSGATNSFLTYSTSPGAEAEDGTGVNSPYTAALLTAAREPNLAIEDTFKRVRLSVTKVTEGRQIPWESSSLTNDFRFFPASPAQASATPATVAPKAPGPARTVESWRGELRGKPAEAAYEIVVADNTAEAYQAFIDLFAQSSFAPGIRALLERRYEMLAWNTTVIINTAAAYGAFRANYPTSDLAPTARKLEERLRNRPTFTDAVAAAGPGAGVGLVAPRPASAAPGLPAPTNASLPGATCPCALPPAQQKKASPPQRKTDAKPPRRRAPPPEEEVVIYERAPPPRVYVPSGGVYIGGGPVRPPGGYGPPPGGGYGRPGGYDRPGPSGNSSGRPDYRR